jgi:hypothetical protein
MRPATGCGGLLRSDVEFALELRGVSVDFLLDRLHGAVEHLVELLGEAALIVIGESKVEGEVGLALESLWISATSYFPARLAAWSPAGHRSLRPRPGGWEYMAA